MEGKLLPFIIVPAIYAWLRIWEYLAKKAYTDSLLRWKQPTVRPQLEYIKWHFAFRPPVLIISEQRQQVFTVSTKTVSKGQTAAAVIWVKLISAAWSEKSSRLHTERSTLRAVREESWIFWSDICPNMSRRLHPLRGFCFIVPHNRV